MGQARSPEEVNKLVDGLDQERKKVRKAINQIALYSNGSYTIQDMYNMPIPYIEEIKDEMSDKVEQEKQAMEKAKGTNRKTF